MCLWFVFFITLPDCTLVTLSFRFKDTALRDLTIALERVQVGLCDDHVTRRQGRSKKNNSVWVLVLGVSIVLLCILGFYFSNGLIWGGGLNLEIRPKCSHAQNVSKRLWRGELLRNAPGVQGPARRIRF